MAINSLTDDEKNMRAGSTAPVAKRPTPPALQSIQQEYAPIKAGYDAAAKRVADVSAASNRYNGTGNTAAGAATLSTLGADRLESVKQRDSFIQPLQSMAGKFNNFTANQRSQAAGIAPRPDFSDVQGGSSTAAARPSVGGGTTAPGAPAQPGASFVNSLGQRATAPAGVSVTRDAAGAPVFTASGSSVTAANAGGTPAAAAPAALAAPLYADRPATPAPAMTTVRGPQGAVIGGPPDEAMRRLENSLITTGRGSPSVRQALIQQYGAEQQRGFDANQAALAPGRNADIQAQRDNAQAAEGFAQRKTAVDMQQEAIAGQERIARKPQITTTADGGLGLIGDNGSFTPVTDAAGKTVQAARQKADGSLTQDGLLKSYTDQKTSIQQDTTLNPEQKQAALGALDADPLFAQLRGNVSGAATATPQAAITALQADPKLAADFDAKYGAGSSARYLSR